jgi:CRP-like cAMP-binding protein
MRRIPVPNNSHSLFRNRLLATLPRHEYERLLPRLKIVPLAKGKTIYELGDNVRDAYFPLNGMLSILSITEDGSTVEVAMVGNEGLTGLPLILKAERMPFRVMVQLPGNAMKMPGNLLREEFNRGGNFQVMLLRYAHTLVTQIAQSAACNRFHSVEKRFCRWLLIARDRVKTNTFPLTQEIISQMLGVPRTSVTMTAVRIQKMGLIQYSRGKITILDREGLERAACECYRIVAEEIEHLLVA